MTLVEIVVCLAIVGLMLAVVPSSRVWSTGTGDERPRERVLRDAVTAQRWIVADGDSAAAGCGAARIVVGPDGVAMPC